MTFPRKWQDSKLLFLRTFFFFSLFFEDFGTFRGENEKTRINRPTLLFAKVDQPAWLSDLNERHPHNWLRLNDTRASDSARLTRPRWWHVNSSWLLCGTYCTISQRIEPVPNKTYGFCGRKHHEKKEKKKANGWYVLWCSNWLIHQRGRGSYRWVGYSILAYLFLVLTFVLTFVWLYARLNARVCVCKNLNKFEVCGRWLKCWGFNKQAGGGGGWPGGGGGGSWILTSPSTPYSHDKRERDGWMDGWMVYCIINGLTITILWVNDEEHD